MRLKSYLLLTLLCLLLYLPGIATIPLLDRDSPHFAQATRQMLETGDPWKINFQDTPRHLKPPGIYWLQAVSVKCLSPQHITTVWAYRVPSVLGALCAVLLTFGFASRFYSERVAFLSAALLASSLLLVLEAHLTVTDACLLATMVLMQGGLWQVYQRSKQNNPIASEDRGVIWGRRFFWLGMALGILIKGLTPIIALVTLLGIRICDRNWECFKTLLPLRGAFFVCLFTAAWLVPLSVAGHSNFLWDMIHRDLLPKVVSGQESHGMPPGYFAVVFTAMFWPGSLFIWQGFAWGWMSKHLASARFLLIWIFSVWIMIELIPTKLPEYALPVYPALAILIAHGIYEAAEIRHKLWTFLTLLQYAVWGSITLLMAVGICVITYRLLGFLSWPAIVCAILLILMLCLVGYALWRHDLRRAALFAVAVNVLVLGTVFQKILPNLEPLWISSRIAQFFEQQATNPINVEKPLLSISYQEPSLVFMLGTHQVRMLGLNEAVEQLTHRPGQWILVNQKELDLLKTKGLQKNVQLHLQTTFEGFNLGDSHWVRLYLLTNS